MLQAKELPTGVGYLHTSLTDVYLNDLPLSGHVSYLNLNH